MSVTQATLQLNNRPTVVFCFNSIQANWTTRWIYVHGHDCTSVFQFRTVIGSSTGRARGLFNVTSMKSFPLSYQWKFLADRRIETQGMGLRDTGVFSSRWCVTLMSSSGTCSVCLLFEIDIPSGNFVELVILIAGIIETSFAPFESAPFVFVVWQSRDWKDLKIVTWRRLIGETPPRF